MKGYIYKVFIFLVVSTFFVSACKRKKDAEYAPSDGTVSETNDIQNQWDNALKISEDALDQNGQFDATVKTSAQGYLGCVKSIVKETIAEGNFIGRITIDFGTSYTNACFDGKIRRGKLIVKYTGKYRDDNTVIQIKTENYYVNNFRVEGRRTVTNTGNHVYSVVDAGLVGTGYTTLTTIDNKITTWKSTRTRTWTEGISTPTVLSDDEYLISGVADGTSSAGDVYSMTISSVTVKLLCYSAYLYMPVSGLVSITSPNGSRSVNYGNGSCDRNVQYTHTNGNTYDITL